MNSHSPIPSVRWSLGAVGMLVAHVVGYGLVDASEAPDHGYLSLALPVAMLLAVLALATFAVQVSRRVPAPPMGPVRLLATQIALYATFEIAERLVGGGLQDLLSWPVLLGLLAQVPVAFALVALVKATVELTEKLVAVRPSRARRRATGRARLPLLLWACQVLDVPVGRRGPPLVGQS